MPQYVDARLGVVEPYFKSLKTGRRIAALARELELVRSFADRNGLELAATVPFDSGFRVAEQAGRAPLDFLPPDAPAIRAIDELARTWTAVGSCSPPFTG